MTAPAERDGLLVVCVLSYNKREATLRCLEGVACMGYAPREVIVVDNASADGSADAVAREHPWVHLVKSDTNRGAAGGRNLGIRYASRTFPYAYMLFLDDDAVPDQRLDVELVRALRADPRAGLATPKAYRVGGPSRVIASAGGMAVSLARGSIVDIGAGAIDRGQFESPRTVPSCVGFAVLGRREALESVGGFDETFNPYGWEEVDLSLRLRRAGWSIRYVPTAIVHHAGGTPGRGRRLAEYERGKFSNYLKLMRRHASPWQWAAFASLLPLRGAALVLGEARRGNWSILRARLTGFADGLSRRRPSGSPPEDR